MHLSTVARMSGATSGLTPSRISLALMRATALHMRACALFYRHFFRFIPVSRQFVGAKFRQFGIASKDGFSFCIHPISSISLTSASPSGLPSFHDRLFL
jgi:hypothetical protein